MEWLWYIIAALSAGIGTGLAGLSAATVMVPILIVLCPSFSGETGAYQATAIALASDILGSAVTAYTYGKHKNIDLKRGWILLLCIVTMCTLGRNVVLGSFTLFLTFCIGIRFLVKPDTSRENQVSKGEKLGLKGIIISILCGLPIGFGTGFVGTGGGMMMLIVFTVFLGMELKTSVGTSTFIMTFTALIASISHILIHPAIVIEKWDVMLLCIVVATVSSLASARFANRVRNRTIGLVTGAVLTLLGAAMLVLYFWDYLSGIELFVQVLRCIGVLILVIVPSAIMLLLIRTFVKPAPYVFRKLLHFVAVSAIAAMVMLAGSWLAAVLSSVVVILILYPTLKILEKEAWFENFFSQKEPGEILKSMFLFLGMSALLVAIGWGLFGQRILSATSILMWGAGDGSAALIGIPFGKHKVKSRFTDGKKTWEGSAAMLAVSFLLGFTMLVFAQGLSIPKALLLAVLGALAGTVTELFTSSEYDTITVPFAIEAVLLLLNTLQ
jgi:hypothetical protein